MSVDYHALLWQQLNKNFGEGTNNTFVMAVGKFLLYSDYFLTNENQKVAASNIFELTDTCLGVGPNYNPTGSRISLLWKMLVKEGKGPSPTPEQQAAFEQAKKALYKDWETKTPTPFYLSYLDANAAWQVKRITMKYECKGKCGDSCEIICDEDLKTIPEYLNWERLYKDVAPMLKAIDEWKYGALYGTLAPVREG